MSEPRFYGPIPLSRDGCEAILDGPPPETGMEQQLHADCRAFLTRDPPQTAQIVGGAAVTALLIALIVALIVADCRRPGWTR